MAHFARTTPPVRPPERPSLPDQYWTAWWQAPPTDAPEIRASRHLEPGRSETPNEPLAAGPAPDETPERGGLRRIGVPPTGAPVAPAVDDAPAPLPPQATVSHWSLLETAATATAPPVTRTARGAFTLEGVAHRSGDLVFAVVTFPEPVRPAPTPAQIVLSISDMANVGPRGIAVADLDGFAPDELGFTLIATSLNPGALWVDGHYDVER
jgi:hypothetical protein